MPKGRNISIAYRELICNKVDNYHSADEIWEEIFSKLPSDSEYRITFKLLKKIVKMLSNASEEQKIVFKMGAKTFKSGRPRLTNSLDESMFMQPFLEAHENKTTNPRLRRAAVIFRKVHYSNQESAPSLSTIRRIPKHYDWNRKKIERRHMRQNPIKRQQFLYRASVYDGDDFVNVDETPFSQEDAEEKYGYAPKDERAERIQIVINGKRYTIIIAATCSGILCSAVYDMPVTADIFTSFVKDKLKPLLPRGAVGLIDNVKFHHSETAWKALNESFHGRFLYGEPYSPDLAPVEKVIGLVKDELKVREFEATRYPLQTINNVLELFSVRGEYGHKLYELFNLYRRGHQLYKQQFN